MDRLAVADGLRELGRLLEAVGAPVYRTRAYERAARTLEQIGDDDFAARIDERRLEELPHVGPAIAGRIEQLWSKGTLPELQELRARVPSGFRELSRIPGLGPKRILELHRALGVETVDDLASAVEEQRVRTVRGFSAAAEARLGAAIARSRGRVDRHLWLAAVREAERVTPRLQAAGACSARIAGDARRAREEVDRLVIVAAADEPGEAAAALEGTLLGAQRTGPGAVRASGADGVPVEVRFATRAAEPVALLRATGPAEHVAVLEARAAARGLTLTEDALIGEDGRPIPLADEDALYAALDLPPVPPELRDDPDALDADPDDFARLLRVEDLVGMVHCHTVFSDGRNTVEEMARAAEALGFRYLTITDHSPSASYAGGLGLDDLQRQWDEIDRVQERVSVVLLRGTESDILADGALDYPDRILEQLDVVIASIHGRHRLDRAAMTARLVRAMAHPAFKIWGHGLGRLVGRRDPIDCDVERVLDVIAESRAAVEINSDPHRLDLPPEWIRRARARGIPLVVSSDAHSVGGMSVLPFGVGIARRAGVLRDEVLNTLSADRFRAAVRPAAGADATPGNRA